jgi:hypothetical protein
MERTEIIQRISEFLQEAGIPFLQEPIPGETFLPGVTIRNGALIADPEKLLYPGDLLHEAGHIAVVPPEQREQLSDNVITSPEHSDGDEIAAILWSYAALHHIGLSPETVFHPAGYKGQSQWYIDNFQQKNYIGLPLLEWMGMTNGPQKAEERNTASYPEMISWLRK